MIKEKNDKLNKIFNYKTMNQQSRVGTHDIHEFQTSRNKWSNIVNIWILLKVRRIFQCRSCHLKKFLPSILIFLLCLPFVSYPVFTSVTTLLTGLRVWESLTSTEANSSLIFDPQCHIKRS